jgi:hypothetical protein
MPVKNHHVWFVYQGVVGAHNPIKSIQVAAAWKWSPVSSASSKPPSASRRLRRVTMLHSAPKIPAPWDRADYRKAGAISLLFKTPAKAVAFLEKNLAAGF